MSDISAKGPVQGHWFGLILFLALTLSIGAISGFATEPGVSGWFQTIAKPSFNPPGWLFAPVWTTLYVLMGVAAWRVWRIAGLSNRGMTLFFVQLALNFAWSFIFFSAHQIAWALVDVVAMLFVIALTAIAFARIDRLAGILFIPYLAWVGFATALNLAILQLNS